MAGVAPIGLRPKRRTAAIVDPSPWDAEHWPMVLDVSEDWYARPEARTRLMVSPADETLSHPHDVQPEEIDIATGIDRMQRALDIEVRRVEHSWAGLRTFTPDGSLAFGWDQWTEGFFLVRGAGRVWDPDLARRRPAWRRSDPGPRSRRGRACRPVD